MTASTQTGTARLYHFALIAGLLPLVGSAKLSGQGQRSALSPRIDSIFASFTDFTPGCGVVLSREGQVLHLAAYGQSNLEYGVPNTPSTVFESGSVAKQFTAAAILALVQDGKLSLEDDIRKYIPEVPQFPEGTITIRHMLYHTSGLRDQWALLIPAGLGPGTQVHTLRTIVDLVSRQQALNFAPGTSFYYSNTNYTLLAVLVERITGGSMQQYTAQRIFAPAGMHNTRWRDDFAAIVPTRATGYTRRGSGYVTDMPFTNVIGNGGLLTTMSDMQAWHQFLDAPSPSHQEIVNGLHVEGRLANGKPVGYAGGLMRVDYRGTLEVGHTGSTAGYRTYTGRYPAHNVSAVVFCNSSSADAAGMLRRMVDLVIPSVPPRPVQRTLLTVDPGVLQGRAGRYRNPDTDMSFVLHFSDGALHMSTPTGPILETVTPQSAYLGAAEYRFERGSDARVAITVITGTDTTRWQGVDDPLTGEALKQYVGLYLSDELDTEFQIALLDGRLALLRRPLDTLSLTPQYRDDFSTPAFGTLRFTRTPAGMVDGMELFALGGRARRVQFARQAP